MDILKQIFPTVNIYNIWLLIPIIMLSFAVVRKLNAKLKKRTYEAKNASKHYIYSKPTKSIEIKFFSNAEFIKRKDNDLRKQGYPHGINASNYYILKSILFILCFMGGIVNYKSITMALILGVSGYIVIDIYLLTYRQFRDKDIKNDLLNVVDCLYLQMTAHVSLKEALRGLHEVCKKDYLKRPLIKLSATYELSEMNIEKAANEFKDSFDILEIDMFAESLKQQINKGSSVEVLSNLSGILKDSYLDKLNMNTKTKIIYITAGVAVVLSNIMALTFFPIITSVNNNMREIFK